MFHEMYRRGLWVQLALAFAAPLIVTSSARAQKQLPGLDIRAHVGLGHDSNSFREAVAVDPG